MHLYRHLRDAGVPRRDAAMMAFVPVRGRAALAALRGDAVVIGVQVHGQLDLSGRPRSFVADTVVDGGVR